MFNIVNLFVLAGLLKLSRTERNPLLLAGIYTVLLIFFNLIFVFFADLTILDLLILAAFRFVFAFIYFWALTRIEGGTWWWVVAILGIFFGLV